MENPILNLATINAITEPHRAIIIETIAKRKHVSFKVLREATSLSNDGLTGHLDKLQKYSLIKGELSDPKNGSYSFYHLTRLGKELRVILHDVLEKTIDIHPDPISDKIIIDSQSFLNILKNKNFDEIKSIFNNCKLVFTTHDYSTLEIIANERNNEKLSDFLEDEEYVSVSSYYEDEKYGSKIEHHLRKIKRLLPQDARMVATAVDLNASIISDNNKILSAARNRGVMCATVDAILELNKEDNIREKFYEISLRKSDSKYVDLQINNNPLMILKKNYD